MMTVGLGIYFFNQRDKGPVKYDATKAEVRDIVNKAVATGAIKPRLEVHVKPQVSGVVEELYTEAGEIVRKGQKLAKIKLIPSEVNVNSARSNVELARIRVQESKRELERQKSIFDNKLDVEEAKRSYDLAIQEEERQRRLFNDGIIAERDYQQAKLDLDVKKNAYENASIPVEQYIETV